MPQIIPPINGFKFVIYFDDHTPLHVHVKKDEFEVKIDIEGDRAVLMKGEENRRVTSNKKYVKQALERKRQSRHHKIKMGRIGAVMVATTVQNQTKPLSIAVPTVARYLEASRELEIEFGPYFKGRWAIDALQMIRIGEHGWESVESPTHADLSEVIIWEGGDVVEFPKIDQHYSITALLRGQFGSRQWMQKLEASHLTIAATE